MTGRIVCALTLLALLLALSACEARIETRPAQAPGLQEKVWTMHPMTGGPAIYSACIDGTLIYALQPLASRATHGLWPGASITAVKGGCSR